MRKALALFLGLCCTVIYAQTVEQSIIAVQGNYDTSEELNVSWTIGDIITETAFLSERTITQGFQQPTLRALEVATSKEPTFAVSVFPNPTSGWVNLNIDNAENLYTLNLLDARGQLIWASKSTESKTKIDMNSFPNATYFLQVEIAKEQRSFQIIKTE